MSTITTHDSAELSETTMTHGSRAVSIAAIIAVAANGSFLSANGLFMLVAPAVWYELVPGVTETGFFNQHFIRDIGMIQLFLGIAFVVGMIWPTQRVALWAAATLVARRACRLPSLGSRRRHLRAVGPPARFSGGLVAGAHRDRADRLGDLASADGSARLQRRGRSSEAVTRPPALILRRPRSRAAVSKDGHRRRRCHSVSHGLACGHPSRRAH